MVGTAVYQVALRLLEPAEETQRVEARRAEDRGAGVKRRQHRGDQPVDVKERHHVEAAIARLEREAARDVRRRGAELACVSATIFGREVVPEVWRMSASPSGRDAAAASGVAVPAPPPDVDGGAAADDAPLANRSSKIPAGALASITMSAIAIPRSAATRRAASPPPAGTITSLAPRSSR